MIRGFSEMDAALNNCMKTYLVLCIFATACTVRVENNPMGQEFSLKTDFSVLNQKQVVTKTSEIVENADGSKLTRTSEQREKGFGIEVVNLKK